MKKFLCAIGLAVCLIGAVAGEKEYDPAPAPNGVYFVLWTNIAAGTATWTYTNNETYMWTPCEWRIFYPSSRLSTNTLAHIHVEKTPQYEETRVVTNDFGVIQTNYLHGLTNTAYLYVTNTLLTVTNTGIVSEPTAWASYYVQRGDVLVTTRGNTSETAYVKITGKR